MRTDQQRSAKYLARMVSTNIDPVIAAVNQKAAANFTTYIMEFWPNQQTLRGLLNDAGLTTIEFGAYEAYHGELYHLTKVTAGATLLIMAQALIDKWSDTAHLGAGAAPLLTLIAQDVYHLFTIGTP